MNPEYLCGVEDCTVTGNTFSEIIVHHTKCHGNFEFNYKKKDIS